MIRRSIVALVLALAATAAIAATANFTGMMEVTQTTTGVSAWRCQYNYNGRTFWLIFRDNCPSMVEVY